MPSPFKPLSLFSVIMFHFAESTPPSISCPPDVPMLEWDSNLSPDITGFAECCCPATNIDREWSDTIFQDCERFQHIERAWKCIDQKTNEQATCRQVIIHRDSTPPTLTCDALTTLPYGTIIQDDSGDIQEEFRATCDETYSNVDYDFHETISPNTPRNGDMCQDTTYQIRWVCDDHCHMTYADCLQTIIIKAADPPPNEVVPLDDDTFHVSSYENVPEPRCSDDYYSCSIHNDCHFHFSLSKISEAVLGESCSKLINHWICTDDCGRASNTWDQTVYICPEPTVPTTRPPTTRPPTAYSDLFDIGDIIYLKPKGCNKCLKDRKKESKIKLSDCNDDRERWQITDVQYVNGVKEVKLRNREKFSNKRGLYNDGGVLRSASDKAEWFSVKHKFYDNRYWISLRNGGQCPKWSDCSEGKVTMKSCNDEVYEIAVDWYSGGSSMIEYLDWNESVVGLGLICICLCIVGVCIKRIIGVNKQQYAKCNDIDIDTKSDDCTQSEEEFILEN